MFDLTGVYILDVETCVVGSNMVSGFHILDVLASPAITVNRLPRSLGWSVGDCTGVTVSWLPGQ